MTPKGFETVAATISAAWPSAPFGAAAQAVYRGALGDLPDDAVLLAVRQLILTSDYLPPVAAIRRAALSGGRALTAAEAWEEVQRNRGRRHDGPVRWSTDEVRRAAETVSWSSPNWQIEQMSTIRSQFARFYGDIVRAAADPRPTARITMKSRPARLEDARGQSRSTLPGRVNVDFGDLGIEAEGGGPEGDRHGERGRD
jgi:hypothetical protein